MFEARPNIDYATRDYEGFRTALLDLLKQKIPEYTDFSESDVGVVLIELLSHGLDIQSYYIDRVANEVHLTTATERGNVIEFCKNYGYTLRNASASELTQIFEVTPTKDEGGFKIPKGFLVSTVETSTDPQIYFETTRDLIIPKDCSGTEQDEDGNYLYTVPVKQGFTIKEELVGSSLGTPDQEFILKNKPVLAETVEVYVNEGLGFGFSAWTKVNNFLQSGPNDKHYVVSIDEDDRAVIKFGNGNVGKIPEALEENILASYRVGGGTLGNVSKNLVTVLGQNIAGIVGTKNISTPDILGTEKETIEEAKRNAIGSLRTVEKAVTRQDYEDLAYNLPFTYLAKAEEVQDGRTINIYILPRHSLTLTEAEIEQANVYYDKHKIFGTKPILLSPEYISVNLTISCIIKKNLLNPGDRVAEVTSIVKDYFSLGKFDFAQTFSNAHLVYHLMDMVSGMIDVHIEGEIPEELTFKQILIAGELTVTVKEV